MTRPNILLITADQWRGDCLGAAGHRIVRTPNIDALAARGTLFLSHFAQAAPCGPSRASLYTGLYQMNHRVVRNGTPLDARHDTIALALRRLGYRPTLFGYTDQAVDPRTVPADSPWLRTYEGILPGFDVAVRVPEYPEPWLAWLRERGVAVPADFHDLFRAAGGSMDVGHPTRSPPRYGADETQAAFLTDTFLNWLDGQGAEPWCAHLSYITPHPPFVTPPPFNTMFPPAENPPFRRAPSRPDERAVHPAVAYWLDDVEEHRDFVPGAASTSQWTDEDFRTVRSVYYGMIAELDAQIGRVVAGLAAAGVTENTVIVVTSDHGELMGDHWALGKFGYFDEAYRIPLIIVDSRSAGGRREAHFTECVDVMPTLIELAGGEPPGHLDGRSLVPLIQGAGGDGWRREVHWEYDFREVVSGKAQAALGLDLDACSLAVIRDTQFKYVHFAGLRPLLFDLTRDSGELTDVSGGPAYAAVRLEYAEKLLGWRARNLDRTMTGIELTPAGMVDVRAGSPRERMPQPVLSQALAKSVGS